MSGESGGLKVPEDKSLHGGGLVGCLRFPDTLGNFSLECGRHRYHGVNLCYYCLRGRRDGCYGVCNSTSYKRMLTRRRMTITTGKRGGGGVKKKKKRKK